MRLSRRDALAALAAGVASAPLAQARAATPAGAYVLPRSTRIALRAASSGHEYELYVRTPPPHAARPPRGWPVILTLDADYQFALCANHLEHLADRMAQAPHAVLVSVAYPGVYPDRDAYRLTRTRDYTPIAFPTGGYGPRFQRHSGGGPAFHAFLREQVQPLVNARFAGDADDWTLVGHSYGGLFAAWSFQFHPGAFRNHLAISPSLWYADAWLPTLADAGERARPARDVQLYLAVGEHEEQPSRGQAMVSLLRRYARAVASWKDTRIRVQHRVFEDETHASIFPAAFSTGIRRLS